MQPPLGLWPNWVAELFQGRTDLRLVKAETLRHLQEPGAEDLNSPRDSVARRSQEVELKNLSAELASVANWT